MSKIIAYVGFGGNCREAMNFYKECIGGELNLQTVGESGAANMMPEKYKDQIIHSSLENGGMLVYGSDMVRGAYIKGNNMTLCVNCDTEAETRNMFAKLSDGGHITDPLNISFWGALFGGFIDKYGIQWVLNHEMKTNQ